VDNLIEDLHCQLMQVYASLGDRAGLVRQYQEMQSILSAELGIRPLPTSERLYQRLLHGV
jgi:DNA-binding SARP family transcriptional activator